MSYRLSRFGSTSLPCARMTATYGTGPTVDATIPTVGGMFDAYSSSIGNLDVPYDITHGCWIVDTEADAQVTLEDLYGMRGQRRILYRIDENDLSYHWCWARCTQLRNPWQWQRKTMNPLDITFQIQTPWYGNVNGTGWSLDSGLGQTLDSMIVPVGSGTTENLVDASETVDVSVGGNVVTRHVSFRLTAGASAVTALTISMTNCNFTWTGTLAATKVLQVLQRHNYCAITNDGSNAYSGFVFNSGHTSGWWMEMQPDGQTTVTIAKTGGGTCQIAFDVVDAWG